jgi:hypothetical protein
MNSNASFIVPVRGPKSKSSVIEYIPMQNSLVMFSTSEDLLKSLPQPIAVVGNGSMKRRYGELIDSYATVIRMNNYRIQGREADVGRKTSLRCTTGWPDIEVRNQYLEFTPFTHTAKESSHLSSYQNQGAAPVITANTDIHPLLPDIPHPSVELALLTLMAQLGIGADVFGFNGGKTGDDWQVKTAGHKTPSSTEFDEILKLPNLRLFDDTHPDERPSDSPHSEHNGRNINAGLALFKKLDLQIKNSRLIEFGAGNGDLSLYLQSLGNQVTAVEASVVAFERIRIRDKIHGDCLDLPLIKKDFDWFISVGVLGNLMMNEINIVISEAARLAKGALVLISTRSGSLQADGKSQHEISWWEERFRAHFDTVTTIPMNLSDQFVLKASGSKRSHARAPAIFKSYPSSGKDKVKASDSCIKPGCQARGKAECIEMSQSALLDIGASKIDAGQHQAAFKTLTSALEADSENAKLVFHLGRLAIACGMMEDAKELFTHAAARSPGMMNAIIDFYHQQLQSARSPERQ